jgi:hypothetical protein
MTVPPASADQKAPPAAGPSRCVSRLWLVVFAIIFAFVAVQTVETALRIRFPYDLYFWSESPFLTNLMKLDQHQPVYTNPADANSFVYSPGLEYLCFAILKPFGLELDIRFDRLVIVGLGLLAAGFGALAVTRFNRSVMAVPRPRLFFLATWGLLWLVLSKNFLADVDHPDNLHACHATLVFFLSCFAVETRRFGIALLTMLVAGIGVFTKQTEALSFLGPLLAFVALNPWGWRRWFLLAAIGAVTVAVSLYLLWLPPDAKFWTLDILRHQRIWFSKSYTMMSDTIFMDRGFLLVLAIIAFPCLWFANNRARRYLVVWMATGIFCVLPNVTAYLKTMGMWNNLIICEIWMAMIVWPFFAMLANSLTAARPAPREFSALPWDSRVLPWTVVALTLGFLLLLVPMKVPPRAGDYAFAHQLENAVRADLQAGRKVLLSHSTEILIRAGVTNPPLDRANSILELFAGNLDSRADTISRINAHYYDRIYLLVGDWYQTNTFNAIQANYAVDYVIPKSPYKSRLIYGYGELFDSCPVLSPRPKN